VQNDDEALEATVKQGYTVASGAHFMKRVIDERIKLPISTSWKQGSTFQIRVKDGEVVVEAAPARLVMTDPDLAYGDVA